MSSSRFPGKMLAPLLQRPLITHVLDRAATVASVNKVALLTSCDATDDPLALYVQRSLEVEVFRGDLENVARRFQQYLLHAPCEWFVRISGDSPAIDPELVDLLISHAGDGLDLVTNLAERTFPPGQSVEVLKTSTFLELDVDSLTRDEREHVTLHYYHHREKYRTLNVRSRDPDVAQRRLVVDTVDDLKYVSDVLTSNPGLTRGYAELAKPDDHD